MPEGRYLSAALPASPPLAKNARLGFVTPIGMSPMLSIAAVFRYSSNSALCPSQIFDPLGCSGGAEACATAAGGAACGVPGAAAWGTGSCAAPAGARKAAVETTRPSAANGSVLLMGRPFGEPVGVSVHRPRALV